MAKQAELIKLIKELAMALADHHLGTCTKRPFAQTYKWDLQVLG